MRGIGKPGATFAELAGITLLMMIPVILVGTGYLLEALDKAETDKVLAEAILTNGEGNWEYIRYYLAHRVYPYGCGHYPSKEIPYRRRGHHSCCSCMRLCIRVCRRFRRH